MTGQSAKDLLKDAVELLMMCRLVGLEEEPKRCQRAMLETVKLINAYFEMLKATLGELPTYEDSDMATAATPDDFAAAAARAPSSKPAAPASDDLAGKHTERFHLVGEIEEGKHKEKQ